MPTVIGIDPGLQFTGIGVVHTAGDRITAYTFGVIKTDSTLSLPARLDEIQRRLAEILTRESPDLMVVEDVFSVGRFPKSGIQLGMVSGVVLLTGFRCNTAVLEMPAREAKKILTGNGNAGKAQLEAAVRQRLKRDTPIKPAHAADALALALIGHDRRRVPGAPPDFLHDRIS